MDRTNDVGRANSAVSEVDEKHKVDVHDEEVAVAKLTEEDLFQLSRDSLQFKGKTGFRITLIMIVMGCNQAGMFISCILLTIRNPSTEADTCNRLRC